MRLRHLLVCCLAACTPKTEHPANTAPAWTATAVATIGTDSGAASFSSLRSLLFSPRGDLYAVDRRGGEIKVFDSTGTFLRRLGRTGSGPGEFREPYSIAWLGDTLALLDPRNARIGLFDAVGRWAGQITVQPLTGGADVRLYRNTGPYLWAYGFRAEERGARTIFIRYTAKGPQDTLPFAAFPPRGTMQITCEYPDRSLHFFDAPFAPSNLQIPAPGGRRAVAVTDRYRIDLLGPTGDTVRTIEREVVLAPISDSAWTVGLAEWNTRPAGGKCDADGFDRPAGKPILAALFYDDRGRLWVEVHGSEGIRYDIYDDTGTQVATVTGLPTSGEVDPAFLDDRIAIALPEDGGFPRIGIYRIGGAR